MSHQSDISTALSCKSSNLTEFGWSRQQENLLLRQQVASGDQSSVVPVTRSSSPSSFQDFHYSQIRGRNNSGSDGNNDSLSHKLACAAATFRAKDKRFSGSYDSLLRLDRIMQLLRITVEQYQVLETSTVSLMANGLDVVAHDYYLERIKGQVNTFSEAFYLLYGLFD